MRERRPNRMPRFDYSSRGASHHHERQTPRRMVRPPARRPHGAERRRPHRAPVLDGDPGTFSGVRVDAFVVMPDHVHGIIVIDDASFVGARHAWPLQKTPNHAIIPVVVGSYKSAVSKLIHRFGSPSFQWQRSYHDTIIRDHGALHWIRRYIGENPVRRGG
jgi:REP element-mobilizing transposase RayT